MFEALRKETMKQGEIELIGLGLVYWFVLNVLLSSNEFIETTDYLFSLVFYFILVYIGISYYKMNDKSVYFSLITIIFFNIIVAFIIAFFVGGISIINLFSLSISLFSLVIGILLVRVYIKIVRYFTEEIKQINNE